MRVLGVIAAALAVAATSLASVSAKDPAKLILRKADFPVRSTYEADPGDDGIFKRVGDLTTGSAGYLGASYTSAKGFLQVSGVVFTAANAAQARKAYAVARAELAAFAKGLRSDAKPITLPKYGNEQTATFDAAGGEGIHVLDLLVRKNTVVWLIAVKREKRPPIAKAVFLAEAKSYAVKQKLRVGNG